MDLRVFIEPQQGASYFDQLAVAQRAEALGFSAFFRSDHYLRMGNTSGLPGPSDSFVVLGGLARETTSIRLGTLVSSITFRHPGVLAISAANVDEMSHGRLELGVGAGWFGDEHLAHAIPFPGTPERFDLLEEQLAIVTGMWATPEAELFDYHGAHYTVTNSPALPKPVQRPLPIIIGGGGPARTPALAAQYAAEFNTPFLSHERFAQQCRRVAVACEAIGRDPATMTFSAAVTVCVGSDDAEVARRAAAIRRDVSELKVNGICGTPAAVIERVQQWAELGAQRLYLQVLDLSDLDHLDVIAREVMPHV